MSDQAARPAPGSEERRAIEHLRSPEAIRERAERVLAAGLDDRLAHFALRPDRLDEVAAYVADVTRAAYPSLDIPYHSRWNHFLAGGVNRMAEVERRLAGLDAAERARCLCDLVITSVLLDAGAGGEWRYVEAGTGLALGRSEGLAVASLHMFLDGAFSSDAGAPLRVDAGALCGMDAVRLGAGFQAGPGNALVGLDGRAELLQRLGRALQAAPHIFETGTALARPGGLFDYLVARAQDGEAGARTLPAAAILRALLEGLGPIWPGRIDIGGVNLGDVWRHPAAGGAGLDAGLVPFHKLSQWLAYSLMEPLEAAGIRVVDVDALTGLPEYRNGGLLVDLGVLVPRHDGVTGEAHDPGAEVIVEWRALTVAMLDRVADRVRAILGLGREQFPLVRVLEGGTWSAGRQIARARRVDGGPPIRIQSDGTVF